MFDAFQLADLVEFQVEDAEMYQCVEVLYPDDHVVAEVDTT